MAIIKPFRAIRPEASFAEKVASPPYDVLNSKEAREYSKGNPHSFLHVTKSEIDLPEETDPHSEQVYHKAKENLLKMISDGILLKEDQPCYYIYQLVMNDRSQTGLVCLSSVQDYFDDVIKKHEFTRPEKEKDRIDHMLSIGAQTGNVFLAYRDVGEINSLVNNCQTNQKPVYDFIAEDNIRHTIWVINESEIVHAITQLFSTQVASTYIADGHHRAASAAKVSKALPGNEEAKYFLTTIFPASQLAILDYNRVVKDLNGHTAVNFLEALEKDFIVKASDEPVKPSKLHEFGMFLEGKWYQLESRKGSYTEDPIGVLDVTILSNNILDKLLGIKDQRTDKRIDFVGGIRGLKELENRVNTAEMKVAFSLHPVSLNQLFDIADRGQVMPPKSTWFEPKLRDGLLSHQFEQK